MITFANGKKTVHKRPSMTHLPTPPLADVKDANVWWRGLSGADQASLKDSDCLVSMVDIAKYWLLNIKGK